MDRSSASARSAPKLTGYPAISIWHDFKYHPKEIISGTQDWLYEHLGALFWVVELWAPNREAGITDYKWIDWYREHPVEDDLKLLKWSDEQCGGQAHVDWKPFMHPQLGAVEIGGWDKMNFWRNPPPQLREREVARFPAWMTQIALEPAASSSCCAPRCVRSAPTPGACASRWPTAAGCRPTSASARWQRKTVRGVMFEIHLPAGRPVGRAGQRQAAHGGPAARRPRAEELAAAPSCPAAKSPPIARSVEWVVRAPQGHAPRAERSRADRAGVVRAEVIPD